MKLFDIIPINFFNIFTSLNREIYVESLLIIWKEYRSSSYILSKEQCAGFLYSHFDSKLYEFKDEEEGEENSEEKNMSGYAKKILRNLIKFGWLEENDELEELETYISIPVYVSEILEAISNIINPINNETDKCVTNVYLNIKAIGVEEFNEWMFLENAYQNTQKLSRLLQDILHNMKLFYNQLLKQSTLSSLYKEHFDDYIESIVYKKYHSLKTEDNLYKFRIEIIKKINELLYDEEMQDNIIAQVKKSNESNDDEAKYIVLKYLDDIKDVFENIDARITQIDRKYNQYLRTTLDRVNYLKNRREDFKGNLIKVLKKLAVQKDSDSYINAINDNIKFNLISSISQGSIYKFPVLKPKFSPEPIQIDVDDVESIDQIQEKIINEHRKKDTYMYSEKFIEQFIEEKMQGKDEINTKNFNINDDHEFIKLILALKLARKQKSKYEAETLDEYVYKDIYKIPEIIFRRK